jgi:UDP-N-acetylglucosamine 2-epimerase
MTSHRHHETIVEQLGQLASAVPEVPLVVKLHRKDRVDFYRKLIEEAHPGRVFVIPKEDRRLPYDIFEWLQGCPLVLTTTSTVAVEAMFMNVPVVTMDFCNEARGVDFIDAGATTHVRTPEALRQAVCEILASGAPAETAQRARQYVESAYFRVDGRAAERGAEEVCRLGGIAWNPAAEPPTPTPASP